MKKLMLSLAIIALITACGSKTEQTETNTKSEISANPVDAYLAIKDALVATNSADASKAATAFLKSNKNEKLTNSLETIANTQDVKEQRAAFEALSMEMYELVKAGNSKQILYKQYCPMAFNNKGAYWLAAEQEVNNPYFGDIMLHCGSVQETISQ